LVLDHPAESVGSRLVESSQPAADFSELLGLPAMLVET
jgi:hypothetical protein